MGPTYRLPDISTLCDDWLVAQGIEAVVWDVDGTLMEYHAGDVAAEFRTEIRRLFRSPTTRHAILSNCGEERFLELGTMFPEVPVVRGYRVGTGFEARHLLAGRDTHSAARLKALLEQGATQVRKPDGRLILEAMRILGISDPQRVLMVGDQLLTDVASANLAGVRGAKVRTYRRDTFPLPLRVGQLTEELLWRLRLPDLFKAFNK